MSRGGRPSERRRKAQRFGVIGGQLRPIRDELPADADRRCPGCKVEGVPDSAFNPWLWFCESCGCNYFVAS